MHPVLDDPCPRRDVPSRCTVLWVKSMTKSKKEPHRRPDQRVLILNKSLSLSPTPIHMTDTPRATTRHHTRNRLLHVRPLRLSREGHVSNIVDIQLAIAPTKCGTSSLFAIPLNLVNCLESGANSRRYHWNL
jgi:hypothetical protein